jgi:hypothetical protein
MFKYFIQLISHAFIRVKDSIVYSRWISPTKITFKYFIQLTSHASMRVQNSKVYGEWISHTKITFTYSISCNIRLLPDSKIQSQRKNESVRRRLGSSFSFHVTSGIHKTRRFKFYHGWINLSIIVFKYFFDATSNVYQTRRFKSIWPMNNS